MSHPEEDEDELDGILDNALAEFESFPPGHGAGAPTADGVMAMTEGTSSSEPDQRASQERSVQGSSQGVRGEASKTEGWDDGLDAFERAIASLDELKPDADGQTGQGGEPTEEEDLKLVEDFLQSLGTEFEKLDMPMNPSSAPGGASGATLASMAPESSGDGALPVEKEIDQLTRQLEALLGGAASGSTSGDPGAFHGRTGNPGNSGENHSEPGGSSALEAEDGASGGRFEKIVESVVGELLSRDVLKGPMEQMRDSYSSWLPANIEKLSESDAARYRKQSEIVARICKEYERTDCSTANVMALLQQMQATGAPPPDVMAKLGSDDDGASGSTGGNPSAAAAEIEKLQNCPVQ